jgi:hypothetical protein
VLLLPHRLREFIDLTYNAEHEVFCFICRERETGRLVVAFR